LRPASSAPQHAGSLQFHHEGREQHRSSGATGEIENSGGNLQFSGGNLNGQAAIYKGGNPPTISFIDDNGEEPFFCQLGQ